MPATTLEPEQHTMQCLEVWGGNHAVDKGVVMAGLDAWLYSRPYRNQSAGGDLHYVSSCAAGIVTRVLIADVSGHGEAVADAARRLRGLMQRYVNFVQQTRLVEGLNREFSKLAGAGRFATAVVATYHGSNGQFTVCNAGHPRPLWYRTRTRTWTFLCDPSCKPSGATAEGDSSLLTNIPLGITGPVRYDQFAVGLAPGDLVVLYTDSLTEARSADGKMLGEEGLLEVVRGLEVGDPSEFFPKLLDAVERRAEVAADDLTVLILRPNGLKPRITRLLVLKTMKRMLADFVASLRPGGPEFSAPESGLFAALGRFSRFVRARRAGRTARRVVARVC